MIQVQRRQVARMPRWQALSTHIIFVICALTGVLYWLAHDLEIVPLAIENHTVLSAHGFAAYFFTLLFGAMIPNHIKSGWNNRRNRASGSFMVLVMALLLLSGLFLYYGADTRNAALWVHWVLGGGLVLLFPLHYVLGRRANNLARQH
jgi:hypothetical protein